MFLKDIRSEDYLAGLDDSEKAAIEEYLHQMEIGPADGEMDIDWQDQGLGYYVHLHNLQFMTDPAQKKDYFKKLKDDIDIWLKEKPGHYMVSQVKDKLKEFE